MSKRNHLALIKLDPDLDYLQKIVREHFKPSFLYISQPDIDRNVQVIIACPFFKGMKTQERVGHVYKLILNKVPDIMNNRMVIVQAFDNEEIEIIKKEFGVKEE
jgi:hypothetical protein